ncbi:MAG: hypothetical protein KAT15_08440, partial [Bacteroidales bacterium]|nr:hypothetical protein [Bacteroidales bacterium]
MADTLFEGYNKLFFSVKDAESGNMISEAELALNPLMHMVDKKHASPAENPNPVSSEEGYFEGAVVFIMPSNPDEGWFLDVDMSIAGAETSASLEIPWVKSLDEPRMIKVLSDVDGTVYFVSCLEPAEPEVGINPCEFTIHYKQSMMSFPAA